MGVEIWSVNYPIDVVEIFGSPSIFKIDILGDLHAKFQDFCSKGTIVSQYHYTIIAVAFYIQEAPVILNV